MAGRAAALACLLFPRAGLAASEDVPVFGVSVTVHRSDRGQGLVSVDADQAGLVRASASLQEDVLLTLSLETGGELGARRPSLNPRYAWTRTFTHQTGAGLLREERGVESGSRLVDWDVQLQRSFRPLSCEDLWIYDREPSERELDSRGGVVLSGLPEAGRVAAEAAREAKLRARQDLRRKAFSGLRLRLRATWPGRVKLSDRVSGTPTFEQDTLPTMDLEWTFPYGLAGGAPQKSSSAADAPGTGLVPPVKRAWEVELSLTPLAPFELGLSATAQPDGSLLFQNRVVAGGRDISRSVRILRLQRTWEERVPPGGPAEYRLLRDWHDAGAAGGRGASERLSLGRLMAPQGSAAPEARRWISEFLEMVEGLPELGLLYHQVTLETVEEGGRQRVAATEARSISPSAWCAIRGHPAPANALPAVSAGWRPRVIAEGTFDASGGLRK